MHNGVRKNQTNTDHGMMMGMTAALFIVTLCGLFFFGRIQALVLYVYAAASAVSFLSCCIDKNAAVQGGWRISETSLHMMALCCGWPGAFAAQRIIRHKTMKKSFQRMFTVCVVLNIVGFVWYAS